MQIKTILYYRAIQSIFIAFALLKKIVALKKTAKDKVLALVSIKLKDCLNTLSMNNKRLLIWKVKFVIKY